MLLSFQDTKSMQLKNLETAGEVQHLKKNDKRKCPEKRRKLAIYYCPSPTAQPEILVQSPRLALVLMLPSCLTGYSFLLDNHLLWAKGGTDWVGAPLLFLFIYIRRGECCSIFDHTMNLKIALCSGKSYF